MDLLAEWLETDGQFGFASGTVSTRRTRRYHALLLVDTPSGRVVLVNGVDIWLETPNGTFGLSTQAYPDHILHPRGQDFLVDFTHQPWPVWRFHVPTGHTVEQRFFLRHNLSIAVLSWQLIAGDGPVQLHVKPLLSCRDYHSLHHENPAFRFEGQTSGDCVTWQPYQDRPAILARSNGTYMQQPEWYRNFFYAEEAHRGLDTLEDLAIPGEFHFELTKSNAGLVFTPDGGLAAKTVQSATTFDSLVVELQSQEENRRKAFSDSIDRAADAYLVQRGGFRTIVAGYPWFTDWGRDTFIALRGLCLATGQLELAEQILCTWAGSVSEGMLPNRFPDHGEEPEYNSVDASLWYIIAVGEFFEDCDRAKRVLSTETISILRKATADILNGYKRGTRYRIRMDQDGLIAAGEPGVQLTWMDAKVGDWVVTPRIGKPVEIQALWINALGVGYDLLEEGETLYETALSSFRERFWNPALGCLYDVVDVDHHAGQKDDAIRPNQIFAVGGLPKCLLDEEQARQVVNTVEEHLWTPLGLRSLSPDDSHYRGTYTGGVWDRDGAYHQGTVWGWLIGPFVEAWLRVRKDSPTIRQEAESLFLKPLEDHLKTAGLGHLSEIADGNAPYKPRGCPFQAWSLGEYLRLKRKVLAHNC